MLARQPAIEQSLWDNYQKARTIPNRNSLVEHYLNEGMVSAVVHYKFGARFESGAVNDEDLYSWGSMGLITAVERFKPEKGYRFCTFAYHHVRGAMQDGLRDADWVPRTVRQKLGEVDQQDQTALIAQQREGRQKPGYGCAFWAANWTAAGDLAGFVTASELGANSPSEHPADFFADHREENPLRQLENADLWRWVMGKTTETRDGRLFGNYYVWGMTMKEAGQEEDLTESRVSQLMQGIRMDLARNPRIRLLLEARRSEYPCHQQRLGTKK